MMIRSLPVLALVLLLVACGRPDDPATRLKARIQTMEEAAEAAERGDFMAAVADDFSGQSGRLGREELADLFRVQLLRHTRVSALLSNVEIEMRGGQRAIATMNALLTGGPRAWLPESGRLYRIDSGWRMDDEGDWYLISAEWEPVLGR